jgi:hypothetical protein
MSHKSELVLIVTAVACALIAASVGALQYFASPPPVTEAAHINEPRTPDPAGPRRFQEAR